MKLIAIAVLVSSAHGFTSNDGIKLCNIPDAATCSANNLCGANGQCTDYSSDTGWVKVMQASAGDNTFRYTHDVWTTSNTYGSANDGTFKNAQFNTLATDKVKVCTNNDAKCYTYNLPSAWGKLTMLELTSGSHRKAADMDMAAWEDVMGNTNCGSHMCAKNGCTMQNPGFNTVCNDGNKARWGFCDNIPSQPCQPDDNHDSDRAIGIGLAGQSSSYASAGVQGYPGQNSYGSSLQFTLYVMGAEPTTNQQCGYSCVCNSGWKGATCNEEVATALTDQDIIHLEVGSKKLDWDDHNGRLDTSETSAGSQDWYMKKCLSSQSSNDLCTTGGLGDSSRWTSGTSLPSVLKTCDVISWYNKAHSRSFDCAWGEGHGCSSQPYPPPGGHWGTPFKIHRDNVACGVEIKNGDAGVYFTRMSGSSWPANYFLNCDKHQDKCYGTSGESATKFVIVKKLL